MKWCIVKGGRWTGASYSGPESDLADNVPAGCVALPGDAAGLIDSGKMLPPTPPQDTADETYEWDSRHLFWKARLTPLGQDKATIRAETERLKAAEVGSLRALREAVLMLLTEEQKRSQPGKALADMDALASAQRAKLPQIPKDAR